MLKELLERIISKQANFKDVLAFIDQRYDHLPTGFVNGDLRNSKEENQGSAKVLSFAKLASLSVQDTLSLFAEHYENVLSDPDGTNHQNIRQFMLHGWDGVAFDGDALVPRSL